MGFIFVVLVAPWQATRFIIPTCRYGPGIEWQHRQVCRKLQGVGRSRHTCLTALAWQGRHVIDSTADARRASVSRLLRRAGVGVGAVLSPWIMVQVPATSRGGGGKIGFNDGESVVWVKKNRKKAKRKMKKKKKRRGRRYMHCIFNENSNNFQN